MSDQTDLFGGSTPLPEKKDAPPKPAYEFPTCWEDCQLCGDEMRSQRNSNPLRRLFFLCERPGATDVKCFEDSVICERAKRKPVERQVKPSTPGWADY